MDIIKKKKKTKINWKVRTFWTYLCDKITKQY